MSASVRCKSGNVYEARDGVLRYVGNDVETDCAVNPAIVANDEYFAAMQLSGKIRNTVCIDENRKIVGGFVDSETVSEKSYSEDIFFALLSSDSRKIGEFCRNCNESACGSFSVIPYPVGELAEIGALLNMEPAVTDGEILTCDVGSGSFNLEHFTENIREYPDTAWLDMAKCVFKTGEGFNAVCATPYDDCFSYRFMKKEYCDGCDTCIMREDFAKDLFGSSITACFINAAEYFPVEIETTSAFREKLRYNSGRVKVVLTDGNRNGCIRRFMGYWNFVSQSRYLWSSPFSQHGRCTVFTHDGFGFADSEQVNDLRGNGSGTHGAL